MKSPFRILVGVVRRSLKFRRRRRPRRSPVDPYILVLRRRRMDDMIYALPLLHALRRHFPKCHLTVACDPPGAPIARACAAVDHVIVLESGWNPWQAVVLNAANLQDYDWVIAASTHFERKLAVLTRLTNAAIRIGVERHRSTSPDSAYFTHPIPPAENKDEHQVETLFRLLAPLGVLKTTDFSVSLALRLPDEARAFADEALLHPPFSAGARFILMNISSPDNPRFREEDFIALAGRILGTTNFAIGLVASLADQQLAGEIAHCLASDRIIDVPAIDPLEVAALMERTVLLITPEGGVAHLAAALGTPALILWPGEPPQKWFSRSKRQSFVRAEPGETTIPVERVWQALQPLIASTPANVERQWADLLELPPSPDPFS